MKHPDYDYLFVMERRRDELAAAEHSRLVKEARAGRRANGGLGQASRLRQVSDALMLSFAQFLSSIGGWLLNLSCRLQTRVEMLRDGTAEPQPNPCT